MVWLHLAGSHILYRLTHSQAHTHTYTHIHLYRKIVENLNVFFVFFGDFFIFYFIVLKSNRYPYLLKNVLSSGAALRYVYVYYRMVFHSATLAHLDTLYFQPNHKRGNHHICRDNEQHLKGAGCEDLHDEQYGAQQKDGGQKDDQ